MLTAVMVCAGESCMLKLLQIVSGCYTCQYDHSTRKLVTKETVHIMLTRQLASSMIIDYTMLCTHHYSITCRCLCYGY